MAVQALDPGGIEVAVGGERPAAPVEGGQAHLAAVGVAGDDRVVAVGGELVEDAQVRRVRDREPHVDHRVGRAGDARQVVVLEVGVVDADEGEGGAPDLERAEAVRQVEPPGGVERGLEVGPRQLRRLRVALAGVGQEVEQRVAHPGRVVVVGAEDVDARHVEQAAEGVGDHRHGPAVGEVVTGVDDQVGLERGEPAQPLLLGPLVGGHVDVAEVEHLQRCVPGREQRHRHVPQGVLPRLPGGVRRQAGAGDRAERHGAAHEREERHSARLPQWAA